MRRRWQPFPTRGLQAFTVTAPALWPQHLPCDSTTLPVPAQAVDPQRGRARAGSSQSPQHSREAQRSLLGQDGKGQATVL